jgi:hypothetical protein
VEGGEIMTVPIRGISITEERYRIGERKALAVGTRDVVYTFTSSPKVITAYFEGDDFRYDFNQDHTTTDSPKVPEGTFLALGVKEVSKMVFKGVSIGGTVYILTLC